MEKKPQPKKKTPLEIELFKVRRSLTFGEQCNIKKIAKTLTTVTQEEIDDYLNGSLPPQRRGEVVIVPLGDLEVRCLVVLKNYDDQQEKIEQLFEDVCLNISNPLEDQDFSRIIKQQDKLATGTYLFERILDRTLWKKVRKSKIVPTGLLFIRKGGVLTYDPTHPFSKSKSMTLVY